MSQEFILEIPPFMQALMETKIPQQDEQDDSIIVPQQGPYLNKYVDVVDHDQKRIGVGLCIRDDFEYPWITEVEMVTPPSFKGRIFRNKILSICISQQF